MVVPDKPFLAMQVMVARINCSLRTFLGSALRALGLSVALSVNGGALNYERLYFCYFNLL
jgi:hypothetical protein